MAENQKIHWTEDQDLLEQYALGRLASEEVAKLESHLSQCARCQDAVRAERDIVAGVKRAGREALKRRLSGRLRQKGSPAVNWYRIAGAAAVVVVLMTFGIYNRWFFQGTPRQVEEKVIADSVAPKLAATPQESAQPQKVPVPQPMAEGAKPGDNEIRFSDRIDAGGAARRAELEHKRANEADEERAAASGVLRYDKSERPTGGKDRMAAQISGGGRDEIWLEGQILPYSDRQAAAPQPAMNIPEDAKRDVGFRKEKIQSFISRPSQIQAIGAQTPGLTVTQQLLSAVPHLKKAGRRSVGGVQTLLQRSAGGMQMTLFLDSLLTEKELSSARIEAIREDSIILILGDRQIGYSIPPDWSEQVTKQSKKTK